MMIISFVGTKDFIFEVSKKIPCAYSSIKKIKTSSVYEIRWNGKKAIDFGKWLYSFNVPQECFKHKRYLEGKREFEENSVYAKYKPIKDAFYNKVRKNPAINVMEYAKEIGIPYQTLYAWKSEIDEEELRKSYKDVKNASKKAKFHEALVEDPFLNIRKFANEIGVREQTLHVWRLEFEKNEGRFPRKTEKYEKIKNKFFDELKRNPLLDIEKYAESVGVTAGTLKKWKRKEEKNGK